MRVAVRHAARVSNGSEPSTVRVGPLTIDLAARRVTEAGVGYRLRDDGDA